MSANRETSTGTAGPEGRADLEAAVGKPPAVRLSVRGAAGAVIALCALAGIVLTFAGTLKGDDAAAFFLHVAKFATFFTILSNAAVAVFCSVAAIARGRAASSAWRFVLLCCITLTGLVYFFLLREVWKPQGAALAGDILLHYVVPSLFVADWLAFDAKRAFKIGYLALAAAVVALYLGWIAALAPFLGVPYPFLDVGKIGWSAVVLWSMLVLGIFLLAGGAFLGIDRVLGGAPKEARR